MNKRAESSRWEDVRSGAKRHPRLLDDGADLVTIAMNGHHEGDPSWWLNLETNPDAVVLPAGQQARAARARRAGGSERDRVWQRWVETPVVLTPRDGTA